MPNHNARIIYGSARALQVNVLIANSDVHFLNDGVSHYNLGELFPKLLTKREGRCYYCQYVIYLHTIGASQHNTI